MQTAKVLESNTRLSYSLMTMPSPVAASPQTGPPSNLTLTFVISCPVSIGQLTLSSITFNLAIGDPESPDSTDLSDSATGIKASVSSSGLETWTIDDGVEAGSFILKPAKGQPGVIANQALTVAITGIVVSRLVGLAEIEIIELEQSDAPNQPRKCRVAVPKFPPGFYVTDFTAGTPQIRLGETVTLTWDGSSNATYFLKYADNREPDDVTNVRHWISPPLYATTAFILRAKVTVNQQTISLDLTTVVIVVSPEIVAYKTVPAHIDYNQPVVLDWRTVYADGINLLTGQSDSISLPANSDSKNPKTIIPQFGVQYALQAFDKNGEVSRVYPLAITFNRLQIISFTATPKTVDLNHQTTTLAWEVANARSVTLNGKTVPPKGSQPENPTSNTTYELAATWVDGSVTKQIVTVSVKKVEVLGVTASLQSSGNKITVLLKFKVENAVSGRVWARLVFFCSNQDHWRKFGGRPHYSHLPDLGYNSPPPTNEWPFPLQDYLDPALLADPNIGVEFTYTFNGFQPITKERVLLPLKGQVPV